jgi:LAO/AO transport system kinase
MELADLVIINKADIDPDAATRARAQINSSLRLLGLHGNPQNMHHDEKVWHPQVIQLSALHAQGVDAFWAKVLEFKSLQAGSGKFDTRRQKQSLSWMWERIDAGLKQAFAQHPVVKTMLPGLTRDVLDGRVAASTAARNMLLAHMQ